MREKKVYCFFSGLFSAISALCILIPFWSIYEILKELLVHASDLSTIDSELMISWGGLLLLLLIVGVLFCMRINVISHSRLRILYGLKIKLSRAYRSVVFGIFKFDIYRLYRKIMEQKMSKNRAFYSSHYSIW